jgi:hypothetical protein
MRNPLKKALVRLRHAPFEGRWTPQIADSYELMIGAHERLSAEIRAGRKNRRSL